MRTSDRPAIQFAGRVLSDRTLRAVPSAAVAVFVALYVVAALAYPGGSRSNPTQVGFSFAHNYWCDLLDAVTYEGRPNPARPVALAALIALQVGLGALFWMLPRSFDWHARGAHAKATIVRSAGVLCALLALLLASRLHDATVRVAGLLGVVALGLVLTEHALRADRALATLTALTLAMAVANYLVWESGFGIRALPILQKAAFAVLLAWMLVASRRAKGTER